MSDPITTHFNGVNITRLDNGEISSARENIEEQINPQGSSLYKEITDRYSRSTASNMANLGVGIYAGNLVEKASESFLKRNGIELLKEGGKWWQRPLVRQLSAEALSGSAVQRGGALGLRIVGSNLTKAGVSTAAKAGSKWALGAGLGLLGASSLGTGLVIFGAGLAIDYFIISPACDWAMSKMDDTSLQYDLIEHVQQDGSRKEILSRFAYKDEGFSQGHGVCHLISLDQNGLLQISNSGKIDAQESHFTDQAESDLDIKPRALESALNNMLDISRKDLSLRRYGANPAILDFSNRDSYNLDYQLQAACEISNTIALKNQPQVNNAALRMATRHLLKFAKNNDSELLKEFIYIYEDGLRKNRINNPNQLASTEYHELTDAIKICKQFILNPHLATDHSKLIKEKSEEISQTEQEIKQLQEDCIGAGYRSIKDDNWIETSESREIKERQDQRKKELEHKKDDLLLIHEEISREYTAKDLHLLKELCQECLRYMNGQVDIEDDEKELVITALKNYSNKFKHLNPSIEIKNGALDQDVCCNILSDLELRINENFLANYETLAKNYGKTNWEDIGLELMSLSGIDVNTREIQTLNHAIEASQESNAAIKKPQETSGTEQLQAETELHRSQDELIALKAKRQRKIIELIDQEAELLKTRKTNFEWQLSKQKIANPQSSDEKLSNFLVKTLSEFIQEKPEFLVTCQSSCSKELKKYHYLNFFDYLKDKLAETNLNELGLEHSDDKKAYDKAKILINECTKSTQAQTSPKPRTEQISNFIKTELKKELSTDGWIPSAFSEVFDFDCPKEKRAKLINDFVDNLVAQTLSNPSLKKKFGFTETTSPSEIQKTYLNELGNILQSWQKQS
jgi:hypothetical protein